MKNNIVQTFKIIIAAVVLSLGVSYVYAWVGPPNAPSDCTNPAFPGCSAPLNVGDNSQSKLGQLRINTDLSTPYATGLFVSGDAIFDNNALFDNKVGIGTGVTIPDTVLQVKTSNNTELLKLTSSASSEIIFEPQGVPKNKFQLVAWDGNFVVSSFFANINIGRDLLTVNGETGNVIIDEGKLIMKSPDGTCSACGPTNSDSWSCSPTTC